MHTNKIILHHDQAPTTLRYSNRLYLYCLGNYGVQFQGTPHNLGTAFAQYLIRTLTSNIQDETSDFKLYTVRASIPKTSKPFERNKLEFSILIPKTYMNTNHIALRSFKHLLNTNSKSPVPNSSTLFFLVVYDELDLNWGDFKVSPKPNLKHNGVKSAVQGLRAYFYQSKVAFIKIGANIPKLKEKTRYSTDYLLKKLPPRFMNELNRFIFPKLSHYVLQLLGTNNLPLTEIDKL